MACSSLGDFASSCSLPQESLETFWLTQTESNSSSFRVSYFAQSKMLACRTLHISTARCYRKNFFAQRNYIFVHKTHSLSTFSLFTQTPPFFAQTPPFFSQPSPFTRPPQLRESRAVEAHWFRWKEIDVLFTIAVTLAAQNGTVLLHISHCLILSDRN